MISDLSVIESFYFIGVGGVSMSALAQILHSYGKKVRGYDRNESSYTRLLIEEGIAVDYCGGALENYQAVVYTDAICENDYLLSSARRLGKILIPRGELLRIICADYSSVIAVAGSHGKTTCTSMLAHVFSAVNAPFTAHIGGYDNSFGNCKISGKQYFITEACEYKRNFLYLKPEIGVILNDDADHLDCYGSAENVKLAYARFAAGCSLAVKLYGIVGAVDGVTFGYDDRADYYAKNIVGKGGKYTFTAYCRGEKLGRISLGVYGKHNVLNALAAIAVAKTVGLPFDGIAAGLVGFSGVKRRFERLGTINSATCIADYAHHPNELKAALKTARAVTEGELFVIFQPHTYSRTKSLFKQFVGVLSPLKKLLVYKTFAAREYFDDAGSALTLSAALKNSKYGDSNGDICEFLSTATPRDTVLVLGAGDIYDVVKNLSD